MTDLLNCPFCGGEAGTITDATRILGHWNLVHRCDVLGPIRIERGTQELVVAAWNRRAALSDHPAVKQMVAEAEARAELALTALHDAYAHQLAACAEWETEMAKARGAAKHKVAAARYAGHYSAMNDLAKRIASLESAAIRGETT